MSGRAILASCCKSVGTGSHVGVNAMPANHTPLERSSHHASNGYHFSTISFIAFDTSLDI
jgi:hypothetical protein